MYIERFQFNLNFSLEYALFISPDVSVPQMPIVFIFFETSERAALLGMKFKLRP